MSKGFKGIDEGHLEDMIEMEYDDRKAMIRGVSVKVHDEFNITVTVYDAPEDRAYSYNGLSDFNRYTGEVLEIDAKSTHLLFDYILKDASIELEII